MLSRKIFKKFGAHKQPIELGYYKIKGLLEPSRWICHHFDVPFVEWSPLNAADWEAKAKTLGPFPSLPYLIDGRTVITENTNIPRAIPQYLAEKAGRPEFMGRTPEERAKLLMVESVLDDIRVACFRIVEMGPGADHAKAIRSLFDKTGTSYRHIAAVS